MKPFRIDVPQQTQADLARRLGEAILPQTTPGEEWIRGIPIRLLESLIDYWKNDFDWQAQQDRLNSYEQFVAELDGCLVHFVRKQATQPGRLPVILTHGWPYTFAEMLPTLDSLHGEMDVIVPSLPGFIFSGTLPVPYSEEEVADRWNLLMTGVLGYDRYLTYGEDAGAGVNDWLAGKYPSSVAGIIASHASFSARERQDVHLSDEELAFFEDLNQSDESGYAHLQATRPDTLAVGLTDSPSSLLAWLVEKYSAWSGGHALDGFTNDELLTPVMLYWITQTIGTSFRPYCEPKHGTPHPIIRAPASLIIQPREAGYPRSLAEKSYLDIRSFGVMKRGGHFPAWEAPEEVAQAILTLEQMVHTTQ